MIEDSETLMVDNTCECCCGDVELVSEHQPDVILFDEFAEAYENDITRTRQLVEEMRTNGATEANATANKEEMLASMRALSDKMDNLKVETDLDPVLDKIDEQTTILLEAIAEIAPSIEINPITTDQINALFPSES